MFRARAAIAIAAAWTLFGPPVAQAALKLSLEEALALAERNSPFVLRARQDRQVVAASRVGAGVLLPANPGAAVSIGRRRDASGSTPPATGPEVVFHIEQAIEVAGQRWKRLAEADRAVEAADARERFAVVEARARARLAYLGALLSARQAESARRREQLGMQIYTSARRRVDTGAASDVELHLATVERARLQSERLEAELAVSQALADLRLFVGLPLGTELELTTPLEQPALDPQELTALIELALARRADLEALARSRSQLDAAVVRLRREVVPNPSIYFDLASQQPGQLYLGGGIALPLPLWRRNQGELAVTRAEQRRLDGELALAGREVETEVAQAFRRALARRETAALWENEVVPAAEANVELVTEGWRAGKFDLFRVIQAAREAGEARRRLLEVVGELWQAVVELDRATGGAVLDARITSSAPGGRP